MTDTWCMLIIIIKTRKATKTVRGIGEYGKWKPNLRISLQQYLKKMN